MWLQSDGVHVVVDAELRVAEHASFGSSEAGRLACGRIRPARRRSPRRGRPSCRTPCRLNVAVNGPFTVTVALNGYLPQSVPVRVMQPEDPRLGSEDAASYAAARLDPNPIFVELERAPRPAGRAEKKNPPPRRPAPSAAVRAPTTPPGRTPGSRPHRRPRRRPPTRPRPLADAALGGEF